MLSMRQTVVRQRGERRERRSQARYPLVLEMTYMLLEGPRQGDRHATRTIDIGSSGLRFVSHGELAVGQRLELAITWPTRLGGEIPLQLVGEATVVRSSGEETAVKLETHAFKTCATSPKLSLLS